MTFAVNLTAVSSDVYHYFRPPKKPAPFIVWYEDAEEGSFSAGNRKAEQIIHGRVDLYTKTEFDPLADDIQSALLNLDGCGWVLDSVQYEDETGLIHLSWQWWW